MRTTMTIEKAYEELDKRQSQYQYSKKQRQEYIEAINKSIREEKNKRNGIAGGSYVEAVKFGALKNSV